jgi:predicted nuclease of predicted toxin-antitoxin system
MKFLADANTPGLLVESLTSLGHDVFWAYTVPRTPDVELIEKAARERRVVITFDKDFGELVFRRGHSVGVVLIRLRDTSMGDTVSVVLTLVSSEGENLNRLFCVVENTRIRKTHLP